MAEAAGSRGALVAVLAGGAGRRIGGAKPLAALAGRPLISYPLRAARAARLEAIVVAKPDTSLPDLREPIVREPAEPRHPLCGVLAALAFARGRPVITVGCDMPLLTGPLLAWLASQEGAAVASADGRVQPLLARHLGSEAPALAQALRAQRSMTATLAALPMRVLGEEHLSRFGDPRRLCFNVNRPQDLALAETWLAEA